MGGLPRGASGGGSSDLGNVGYEQCPFTEEDIALADKVLDRWGQSDEYKARMDAKNKAYDERMEREGKEAKEEKD